MRDEIKPPHGAGMERVTITVLPDQLERLDDLGREWGLNRSEMTRLAIVKLLRDPTVFFLATVLTDTKRSTRHQEAIIADDTPEPNGEGDKAA